jgi:hypothetical protein
MEVMNMRITILPKTPLGWWSVGLTATFILVFGVAGMAGLELQSGSVGLMTFGAVLGILDIGAIVTGLISIIKTKERSVLVFLVLALSLFFWVFLPGFWIPSWNL